MAPLIAACPRGSYIRSVRMWSRWVMKWRRRSAIVAPGMTPTPPVTTRVGIPSVWEPTAWKSCRRRSALLVRRVLGGGTYGLVLLGDQRQARVPARPAVSTRQVHRQLDGLDELGTGVPAQQRVQGPVERQGAVEVAGGGGAVQRDARLGQRVRVPRAPALGSRDAELQLHVVRADLLVQPGGQLGDPVRAPDVAAVLLDRHDVPGGMQPREQLRGQVDLGVVGVVVCLV